MSPGIDNCRCDASSGIITPVKGATSAGSLANAQGWASGKGKCSPEAGVTPRVYQQTSDSCSSCSRVSGRQQTDSPLTESSSSDSISTDGWQPQSYSEAGSASPSCEATPASSYDARHCGKHRQRYNHVQARDANAPPASVLWVFPLPTVPTVAIDCEFVGGACGPNGKPVDVLASIAIVDEMGQTLYYSLCNPGSHIVADYRTYIHGLTPAQLAAAPNFATVQREVSRLLAGRVVVGHSVLKDLEVLGIFLHLHWIRDVALLYPDQYGRKRRLRDLAQQFLGQTIQTGPHSAVEDAAATMALWQHYHGQGPALQRSGRPAAAARWS